MFLSSVAHELRTPLNSIIPMVKILCSQIPKENLVAHKFLTIVSSSAMHLQNVIEDALDMSSIENNKFEVNLVMFDPRQAIEEVLSIMQF
jgi:signal transduction histidine kinase